jgi:hypothetical protein
MLQPLRLRRYIRDYLEFGEQQRLCCIPHTQFQVRNRGTSVGAASDHTGCVGLAPLGSDPTVWFGDRELFPPLSL